MKGKYSLNGSCGVSQLRPGQVYAGTVRGKKRLVIGVVEGMKEGQTITRVHFRDENGNKGFQYLNSDFSMCTYKKKV